MLRILLTFSVTSQVSCMNVLVAAIIAIVLIPTISYFTSRMKSLPIDFVSSAISISVISLDIFSGLTKKRLLGEDAVYVAFLVNLAIFVLSIIAISGYLLYDKDKTEYREDVKKFAYIYSLGISCVVINFAYIYVKHSKTLFSSDFDKKGALANFLEQIFTLDNDFKYVILATIVAFVLALLVQLTNLPNLFKTVKSHE